MITQKFKSGKEAVFTDGDGVYLPGSMTVEEFAEFMPLAMHVYHQSMPQYGLCPPAANYADMGGKLVNGKISKKRGRPPIKTTTAKRGRPRKANKE